ncbi:MAG: Helix-turn-helix, Fis-type [Proteobacteria bacterium]|nr:Helix-turn-helix, Fis-type [Pseudomonadota bacterium]
MDLQKLNLVGTSLTFLRAVNLIRKISTTDAPVLAMGETGTGKEMAARAIHYLGSRHEHPFIPINCGGLPEQLIENELFGHERGAYTDARESRPGVLAQANGGTLFLDEVDSLSLKGQIALLRFLQDLSYRPVGGVKERYADVRVIAAAGENLLRNVETGAFRRDLFYRLRVLTIELPPLRERPGDAVLLAQHFLELFSQKYGKAPKRLDQASIGWIMSHSWPGNVRELENLVLREVLLTEGEYISIGPQVSGGECRHDPETDLTDVLALDFNSAKRRAVEAFERHFLCRLLADTDGNVTRAAQRCGKERRALGKLIKKYGLSRECGKR